MKKIVKISMLALLGLGLAGCTSSEYDGSESYSKIATYLRILEDIRNNEYEIDLENRQEAVDFVKTISKADLENIESIDYSKRDGGYVVLFKFKKSQSDDSSPKIEEKIIEKDGKRYRVIVEEIVEDPVEEVAKKAVEETTKSGE